MAKITEELLLERGSPNTGRLEDITTLSLSKLGLGHQDLPLELLSRLCSLQRLDLSGNRLQEFPRKLQLPRLHFLDLSDNQMEEVTSLEALSGLEELNMEDNLYITVSDNHKLMVLLPNLKIYNGKDVSSSANHLRFAYSQNLRTRIAAVWEKSFSIPHPVTVEKVVAVETEFINKTRQLVKFGPSSVSDFTKWRVEILAREFLRSLTEPKEETEKKNEAEETQTQTQTQEVLTPIKKKQQIETDATIRLTPRKRAWPSDAPAEGSPRKTPTTAAVRMSPRKRPRSPAATGRAAVRTQTPRSAAKAPPAREGGAKLKEAGKESQRGGDILLSSGGSKEPPCLKPLHVLQCHSKEDSDQDFSTQLWACAFQPLPETTGGGSRLVATCGGDSLCVIDCESGMVMKKYKVLGEEFFSLAWSTVLMSRGGGASAQHCSILAAGGKRGLVKLLHPRNNVAFGEFRASRRALSVLRFHPQRANHLFTGSYDNKIVMWDVGGVDSHYNYNVAQLLVLESSSTPLHMVFPPAPPSTHLLSACEDGLHCYNTQLGSSKASKSKSTEMEITFPIYDKEDKDHDYHTIDGLSFLTDDIVASKNVLHSRIYLWSWSKTRSQRPGRAGSVRAVVLAELEWADTDVPYLALNTCPGRAFIACGDDRGRLWTYHITKLQQDSFLAGKPIRPTEVLAWPGPVRRGSGPGKGGSGPGKGGSGPGKEGSGPVKGGGDPVDGPSINSVAMDPELQYLVALSDKNMVMVWRRGASC